MAYRSSDQSTPGAIVFQCYFSLLLIVAAWRLVLQVSGSVVDSVLADSWVSMFVVVCVRWQVMLHCSVIPSDIGMSI